MSWENGADAQRNIPLLTEDEELIWSGLGSMAAYLEAERCDCDGRCRCEEPRPSTK